MPTLSPIRAMHGKPAGTGLPYRGKSCIRRHGVRHIKRSMPLKIIVRSVASARESGDLMVVGTQLVGAGAGRPKKNERSTLDGFDQALGGALGRLIKREDFRGKKD